MTIDQDPKIETFSVKMENGSLPYSMSSELSWSLGFVGVVNQFRPEFCNIVLTDPSLSRIKVSN